MPVRMAEDRRNLWLVYWNDRRDGSFLMAACTTWNEAVAYVCHESTRQMCRPGAKWKIEGVTAGVTI